MLILALDTSGAAVTAAVHDGRAVRSERSVPGARGHAEQLAPLVDAVLADAAAGRDELTAIAVGVGPGPFTGLRVGVVTARVLGYALGIDVVGICSLDALAHAALGNAALGNAALGNAALGNAALGTPPVAGAELVVATDARRREVYWAAYRVMPDGAAPPRAVRVDGPHVGAAGDVPRTGRRVVGRGALLYPEALLGRGVAGRGATTAGAAAEPLDAAAAEPLDVAAGALAELAARGLSAAAGDPDAALLLAPEPLYLRRPDATEPGARKRVLPAAGR